MRNPETSPADNPANPERRIFLKDGALFFAGMLAAKISGEVIDYFKISPNDKKKIEVISKEYGIDPGWLEATALSLHKNPDMKGAIYTTDKLVVICAIAENGQLKIEVLENQGPNAPKKTIPTKNQVS